MLEDFTKETGIRVVYDVFDSNEVLETKLLAGSSGYDSSCRRATFLNRQIKAGVFQQLDQSKIPNLEHVGPEDGEAPAVDDPGNAYSIIYMWGTTGHWLQRRQDQGAPGRRARPTPGSSCSNPNHLEVHRLRDHVLDSADDIMPAR